MRKTTLVALGLLLAAASTPASAGVYVLPAEADTWIDSGDPYTNHGTDTELRCQNEPGAHYRSLLRFDFSSIPAGETVVRAYLQFLVTDIDAQLMPVNAYRVTKTWTETEATWQTTGNTIDIGTVQGSFVPAAKTFAKLDVTDVVLKWLEGKLPNHGLALIATSTNEVSKYASRETAAVGERPVLILITGAETTRMTTGHYIGDGLDNRSIAGLGFRPDLVFVKGDREEPTVVRSATMSDDAAKELGTSTSLTANRIQSLDTDGFTVGSDTAVNAAGADYYWVAFRGAPGQMALGYYLGDDSDDRLIDGLGFEPGYVIVMGAEDRQVVQRFPSEIGDASRNFDATGETEDHIQSFAADGFQIGKHAEVNKSEEIFHYVAWQIAPGVIEGASYLGTGADDRDIIDVGFRPGFMILSAASSAYETVHRPGSLTGDKTLVANGDTAYENGIQTFLDDGFQVGSDVSVNRLDDTYHWIAFRDKTTLEADLEAGIMVDDSTPNEGDLVDLTITLRNTGPDPSTGVQATDLLPAGLSYATHFATQGSYESDTGLWTVGALAAGQAAGLFISTTVEHGFAGTTLIDTVAVTAADQLDPDPSNNIASISIRVLGADLAIAKLVDEPNPNVGDSIRYTVTIVNDGPTQATGIEVTDLLPDGLTYVADSSSQGAYNSATGRWSVGALAVSSSASLVVTASVDPGTGSSTITNEALIAYANEGDPDPADNTASTGITVQSADIVVAKVVDDATPAETDLVTFTVTARNVGPDDATRVQITDLLPDGLTYDGHAVSQGSYDSGIGVWDVGTIAPSAAATLTITSTVNMGTGGWSISNVAALTAMDQEDPTPSDDVATVSLTVQSSTYRVATGHYVGDGAGTRSINGVGFHPDVIIVAGDDTRSPAAKTTSMTGTGSKELAANTPMYTNIITSLDADGFTVSPDGWMNIASNNYYWIALQSSPLDMAVGSYVGNGSDNRAIGGLAFTPGYVIVMSQTANEAVHRFSSQAGDASLTFGYAAESANRIQAFQADGFQVGSSTTVNQSGVTYHYVAWRNAPGLTVGGSYDGDGFDNRDITGVGFAPAYLILKKESDTNSAIHRSVSLTGDSSLSAGGGYIFNNGIQSFLPDGFQVGSNSAVNEASQTHYWTAFRDRSVQQADLAVAMSASDTVALAADTLFHRVVLTNNGADPATGVRVTMHFTDGITLLSAAPSKGTYNQASRLWSVGSVAVGELDTLVLTTAVRDGLADTTLTTEAEITDHQQVDYNSGNNTASARVHVLPFIVLDDTPASLYPARSYADNSGLAIRVGIDNPDPVGVMLDTTSTVSFTDGANTFIARLSNPTYVPPHADNFTTGFRPAPVPSGLGADTSYALTLSLSGERDDLARHRQTISTEGANDLFIEAPVIRVDAEPMGNSNVNPGQRDVGLLVMTLQNEYSTPRSLASLSITNTSSGPGSQADLDTTLESLGLFDDVDGSRSLTPTDTLIGAGAFSGGRAVFAVGGAWGLDARGSRTLLLAAHVDSTLARDGDRLDAAVEHGADIVFTEPTTVDPGIVPASPVNSLGYATVDGMVAHQISATATFADTLASGASGVHVATFVLPANGYEIDYLTAIRVKDFSGDFSPTDLSGVRLYADDGDTVFDPVRDTDLGGMVYSGDRYELSGLWSPIDGARRLLLVVNVAPHPETGHRFQPGIPAGGVEASSGNDGPLDAAAVSPRAATFVRVERIEVTDVELAAVAAHPGDVNLPVLHLKLYNNTLLTVTLDTLRMENLSSGPGDGSQADLDAEISQVSIYDDDGNGTVDSWDAPAASGLSFAGGRLTVNTPALTMDPGEIAYLLVACDLDSTCARDGDSLRVSISSVDDMHFEPAFPTNARYPFRTNPARCVDGMMSFQIAVTPSADSLLITRAADILVLDFAVPANGYTADTLAALTIANQGTAADEHVSSLRLYADGGNGVFDQGKQAPGDDNAIGGFVSLGDKQYSMSGIDLPLVATCPEGTRFFVSCDLAPDFLTSASFQFGVPMMGIEVHSGNDGPIDAGAYDPSVQFIPTPDKLTVFPYSTGDKRVRPGQEDLLNFGLALYNGFKTSITLDAVTLFQRGAVSNDEIERLTAYADADTNGLFSPLIDTPVATATPAGDVYETLSSLGVELHPEEISYLFVAYDLALGARDSVDVDLRINTVEDLELSPPVATDNIDGVFPVNSPGVDVTDGMIADQVQLHPAPFHRAAPGDNNVLAFGFTLPANGSLSDALQHLTVLNSGTAVAGLDVSLVSLWVEAGGDPERFEASSDRLLSIMMWSGSGWRNPVTLDEAIPPPGGLRCYVTFSVAASASDDRTIQSVLPVGGVQVLSGNDGPIDRPLTNPNVQSISTDPLISTLALDRRTYSTGQEIVLTMRVRDEGVDSLLGVTAPLPIFSGDGVVAYLGGPEPAAVDLGPGGDSTLVWRYRATAAGDILWCGLAHNGDSSEVSLESCTEAAVIESSPTTFTLSLHDETPIAVNRGQRHVGTMSARILHATEDTASAPLRFNGIDIFVEDQNGTPLPPNSLLSEITVLSSSGTNQPFDLADSTSNPLHLRLPEPVKIPRGDSISVDVDMDISASASFSPFRVSIAEVSDISVVDANKGTGVSAATGASFPWRTNMVDVAVAAESLLVSAEAPGVIFANNGQDGVEVFRFSLLNNGPPETANEILRMVELSFSDTSGAPIAPAGVVRSLEFINNGSTLYSIDDLPPTGHSATCNLTNQLLLPPGDPKEVTVRMNMKSFPSHEGFYVSLDSPSSLAARDNNNGGAINVATTPPAGFPIESSRLLFQEPASGVATAFTSRVPEIILPSTRTVPLIDVVYTHADASAAASITVDSLAMAFVDRSGSPFYPGNYFSQLCAVHAGDTLCVLTSLSSSNHVAECTFSPPITLEPNCQDTLRLYVASKDVYSPAEFQVRVDREHVVSRDANTGERILSVQGVFPYFSDTARLQLVGNAASCALVSRVPPNVSGRESELAVFDLLVRNDNPLGYTPAVLRSLLIEIRDWKGRALDPSSFVAGAALMSAESVLVAGVVGVSGISIALPDGLVLEPATTDTLTFAVDLSTAGSETFRFVIADTASLEIRDAVTGEEIAVGTIGNTGYPLQTALAHMAGSDPEAAFTNYPNPFAAGRENTRITYYLESSARVTLKIYTLWGEPVETLLDGESRTAGLHQDATWSGRNGDGDLVANGVYYLVLEIEPATGSGSTFKRKVGVVR